VGKRRVNPVEEHLYQCVSGGFPWVGHVMPRKVAVFATFVGGRVGRSISTPASRRTVRETLTSYSSHQANMPVTPSFQCTNSLRLLTAMTSINRPARIFAPL
jgi:hypothetical protein